MGLSRGVYRMQGTVVWDGTLRELEEKVEYVTEMAGSPEKSPEKDVGNRVQNVPRRHLRTEKYPLG